VIDLEIKEIDSADVDIGQWRSDGSEQVYLQISMNIGETGSAAGDLFQTIVATPEGLRQASGRFGPVVSTRGLMVVSKFSWQLVRNTLTEIVVSCAAEDWPRSVLKLERYFIWEYEDVR